MSRRGNYTASVLVRMTPEMKRQLESRAEALGDSVSNAMREGALMYFNQAGEGSPETDSLSLDERVKRLERHINDRHFGGER